MTQSTIFNIMKNFFALLNFLLFPRIFDLPVSYC